MSTEEIEGEIIPDADTQAEATQALERVEREGLMPEGVEASRGLTYREAVELGHVLARSGYFKDAQDAAKAAVKVMVGSELGFAPMASMMGVHVIEGRPSVGGRLLGAIVRRDPHYDYVIDELTVERDQGGAPIDGKCTITITLDGKELEPKSTFTWGEAKQANLVKDKGNWLKWPTKMLFWRALSWGIDFHCPHLVGGMPLLATEDVEADADDGPPPLVRELDPPAQRPPALHDDEAEKLRKAAQEAYDGLRGLNPTLVPPAKFANQVANAEHSHERLKQVVAAFEDLRDTEQTIVDSIERIRELYDDEPDAQQAIDGALSSGSRAEIRDALVAAVQAATGDDDEGGDDDAASAAKA